MRIPSPEPGLVISYDYLWLRERKAGAVEGVKSRPCVIVLYVKARAGGKTIVAVAPITHSPPAEPEWAVELPAKVRASLGLDDTRSWVVCSEVNQFEWPGYDIRPVPKRANRTDYGFVPPGLLRVIVERIGARFSARSGVAVNRD